MVDIFRKISNLVGIYLNSIHIPYTFEHKKYSDRIAVEFMCCEHVITVNMSTITNTLIIWGRIQKGAILGPQYRLLEQLEDFKRDIRTKCIFDRVCEI
jgi:hypothetical protein